MTNIVNIFLFLAVVCSVINGKQITEKHVTGPIDRDDDYWVIKVNGLVNRPTFPAYIRFYNIHKRKIEYQIDCSKSALIHYYNGPPASAVIFRTTGHYWTEGDSYYVTLDEGALYSDDVENSAEYSSPDFWPIDVVRPYYPS